MPTFWIKKILNRLDAENPLRYLRSAGWLVAGKMASMIVSLIAIFYVARALGPQNFGELSYAQSVVGILALFSSATAALYRDLIKFKDSEVYLLGTAYVVSLVAAIITITLALAYAFGIPHDYLTIYVIGILAAAQLLAPFSIIQFVFQAKTETKQLSITNFLVHTTIAIAKVIAMTYGKGVIVLAIIMFLEQLLIAISYAFLYIRIHGGSFFKWKYDLVYMKSLIYDSLPIIILAGSSAVSARVDQIFLRHFVDTATVGFYAVAVQLTEIWHFIPGIILTAIFPAIINAKDSPHMYRSRLKILAVTFLCLALFVSLLTYFLAPYLVSIIYGASFAGAIPILKIYTWSYMGALLGFVVNYYLLSENLRKIQIITAIIPMLLNVLLNVALIPKFGAEGAALATVVAYSIIPLIPFLFSLTRQKLSPRLIIK